MTRNNLNILYDSNDKISEINGKYKDDVDIIFIDKEIKKRLDFYNENEEEYIKQTKNFITQYSKIGRKKVLVDYSNKKVTRNSSNEDDEIRLMIIGRYLFVIEIYIDVDIIHDIRQSKKCLGCNNKFTPSDDSENYACECGYEKYIYNIEQQVFSKGYYKERENFIKAMYRQSGKIEPNFEIVKELMKSLDIYFINQGLKSGEEIRALPLLKDGTKKGTSQTMLVDGLSAIGRPLYEYIPSIAHKYWGWAYQDIRFWEDKIMEVYDKTQAVWESIPRDRRSNITTQFRLLATYKLIGYPCNKKHFKLIKTEDSIQEHMRLWKIMLEKAGYSTDNCNFI